MAFSISQEAAVIPWHWDVLRANAELVAKAGTWQVGTNTSSNMNKVLETTSHALNDQVVIGSFYISEQGSYDIKTIGATGADRGIVDVYLNGASVASIDLYEAAGTYHNRAKTTSLGTLTVGLYEIGFKVASKNASSTNYYATFSSIEVCKS